MDLVVKILGFAETIFYKPGDIFQIHFPSIKIIKLAFSSSESQCWKGMCIINLCQIIIIILVSLNNNNLVEVFQIYSHIYMYNTYMYNG